MVGPVAEQVISQAVQGLREIGYADALLQRDYAFADLLSDSSTVRQIPLAAFAQDPPSYRNACFGVISGGPAVKVAHYRALGAPQLLEVADHEVRRWKVTADGEPELLDRLEPDDVLRTIRAHRKEWGPETVLRAKSIAFDSTPVQLDFFDAGLVPSIEAVVQEKLDRLLRHTLAASQATYSEQRGSRPDSAKLFRLVFRLLAAKLFADRGHPGDWTSSDPAAVVAAVERFYFGAGAPDPAIEDPATQQAAWRKIRTGFHLQNISVEALAYVYENTLVDRETRKRYGTHSTPREIAEYVVRRLPFESLAQDERRVFEPCAGHGAFLIAALGRLRALLPADVSPSQRHEYLKRMLSGMEIDPFAREVARLSLMLADYPNPNGWRLIEGDVFDTGTLTAELGRANAVLCNPPFEDFTSEDRERYRELRTANKASEVLLRTLDRGPALLGFVLPRPFVDGQYYRDVRRRLVENYADVEIVALPDSAFQRSGVETVLLIASGKGRGLSRVRSAEVTKRDYTEFVRTGRPTREDEAEASPEQDVAQRPLPLWLPPLRRVWRPLDGLPTLGEVADIHNGIYYKRSLRVDGDALVSAEPRDGFQAGLTRVSDGFEPLVVRNHMYLSVKPQDMYERSQAHLFPWDRPKVIVNGVRLSRGPWVVAAAPDRLKLVAFHLFHALWPTGDLSIEVLAAILNGPVANAFVGVNRTSRHNRIDTLKRIPIPRLDSGSVEAIRAAVAEYRRARLEWLEQPLGRGAFEERCRAALHQIDALLLTAYDLPPRLERELLDYFAGHRRPGPVAFDRYYPEGFRPALPWRLFVSGAVRRAGAHETLRRVPVLRDRAISEAVAELG